MCGSIENLAPAARRFASTRHCLHWVSPPKRQRLLTATVTAFRVLVGSSASVFRSARKTTEMTLQKVCFSIALSAILCSAAAGQFIYLNSGLFKFIAGVGLPIDAELSGGSLSWFTNFQAFYKLPDNITYFEPYKIVQEKSMKNTFNRASLYEALLKFSRRFGFSGGECIHRLICEVAHRRINRDANGLLGEIIHILFTPGRDSGRGLEGHRAAERQGLYNSSACGVVYKDCFLRGNAVIL